MIGFTSAIAAYGAFFIPKAYGSSIAATGGPELALWGFLTFYVTCVAVTWWFYTRRGGLLHDIERGGPARRAVDARKRAPASTLVRRCPQEAADERDSSHRIAVRSSLAGVSLVVLVCACGSSALAQDPAYNPEQGSGGGPYHAPHTGILNGRFWTDTRYRFEYVDQANLPKDARASTIKNKTGVEFGLLSRLPGRRRRRVRARSRARGLQQHDQRQDPISRRCRRPIRRGRSGLS